jgi:hypothetical protein
MLSLWFAFSDLQPWKDGLTRPATAAMVVQAVPAAQMPPGNQPESSAGLVFKISSPSQMSGLNVGAVVQEQVTRETQIQEQGAEYVDNCSSNEKAVGHPHQTSYRSDIVSSRDVTPYNSGPAQLRGSFVSPTTPPAPGLRVVVRNASFGSALEQMPYTDREYNAGVRSEGFVGRLGTAHSSKFLALQLGANPFIYEIKRGSQVIESGQFTSTITQDFKSITSVTRIARPKYDLECRPKHRERGRDRDRGQGHRH